MWSYQPLVLGFVLDLDLQNLISVKSKVIECVRRLESDDRGYVFHPSNLEILRHSGPVVASISNYKHPDDFNLEFAIKQTVILVETQDAETKKYIFVILDKYEDTQEYGVKKAMGCKSDCKFIFFGIGKRFSPSLSSVVKFHPRCQFIACDINLLVENIVGIAEIQKVEKLWKK